MATLQATTNESLQAQIDRLLAENEALKAGRGKISYKVSGKGAVSAYGLGQFPFTAYAEQWERLDADAANRKAFIEKAAKAKILAIKGQPDSPELVAHSKVVAAANAAKAAAKA